MLLVLTIPLSIFTFEREVYLMQDLVAAGFNDASISIYSVSDITFDGPRSKYLLKKIELFSVYSTLHL